jgi:putative transposase
MSEWLVTLRKHRNYCLAERKRGFETNNQHNDQLVCYEYGSHCEVELSWEIGSYCDINSYLEVGAFSPLTCPVVKHGVTSAELTKISKKLVKWGNVSDVQGKKTTELRNQNPWYGRVNSDVLQANLSKLDAAYNGFFTHKRGFPAFRKAANFKSFQYKPGKAKLTVNRTSSHKRCYSHIYLPGIGDMRYLDSRTIPTDADIRTITVKKEADGWYISVLLNLTEALPSVEDKVIKSSVGIDVGINKLCSLSDGSFIENPKFAKKSQRLLRIRQRRVSRKVKGSKNRSKAGILVAKFHKQIRDKREAYQWQAASKIVKTADAVVHENLKIKGMKARCKTKRSKTGRAMPNGQSAKRGLNRSINDASWGSLFQKIGWLGAKAGKPVLAVDPKHTSQECSNCHHKSKDNRDGEKFICVSCGHLDHADTQASRTINKRAEFKFVSKDIKSRRTNRKCLSADCGKVTPSSDSAACGKRDQVRNCTFKVLSSARAQATPEKQIFGKQLELSLFPEESPSL